MLFDRIKKIYEDTQTLFDNISDIKTAIIKDSLGRHKYLALLSVNPTNFYIVNRKGYNTLFKGGVKRSEDYLKKIEIKSSADNLIDVSFNDETKEFSDFDEAYSYIKTLYKKLRSLDTELIASKLKESDNEVSKNVLKLSNKRNKSKRGKTVNHYMKK